MEKYKASYKGMESSVFFTETKAHVDVCLSRQSECKNADSAQSKMSNADLTSEIRLALTRFPDKGLIWLRWV